MYDPTHIAQRPGIIRFVTTENQMFSGSRGSKNEESMFISLDIQFYKMKKF